MRLMITGAAPVSATVLTFLRAALGCQFYEGYGQTECTAGCCLTVAGDWTAGHVGPPMPCSIIKLVDVEEMNYLAAKGEGEVCVKGSNVFQGYLKDPVKTAEALDKDGWLHTGDIGKWLPVSGPLPCREDEPQQGHGALTLPPLSPSHPLPQETGLRLASSCSIFTITAAHRFCFDT